MTTPSFEQGPIRPPSEARSLLVRVTRNCPWNKCAFCPVYKGAKYATRSVEDVLADVAAMAAAAEALGSDAMHAALESGRVPPEAYQVALFLRAGARHVFLQDADPLAVRPENLARIVGRVRDAFPSVDRVTTYGRAATLARRRPSDLALLADAGLTRVHLGLESGADAVLMRVNKGCTAEQLVTAGRHVLGAGLELCFYVMPGLGGRDLAGEHVRGTAAVLRAVAASAPPGRPLVVRLRTAAVIPGTPLAAQEQEGDFALPDDIAIAAEIRDLLAALREARIELRSDHALNLFPGLEGSLPEDRESLLATLDEFLGLSPGEQAEYALGARLGIFRTLAQRRDPERRAVLAAAAGGGALSQQELLAAAARIRSTFV